jgi:beta-glucosidase
VLFGGSPMVLGEAVDCCDTLLWVGYPGQAGGEAIARIIFGQAPASGKLPFTLYKQIDDLPPFDDYSMKGRTYRYMDVEPEFPFGFGLSSSIFELGPLSLSSNAFTGEPLAAKFTVANTGDHDAEEVVQLYVRAKNAPFPAPRVALKDFRRISVPPGSTIEVEFTIDHKALELVDPKGKRVLQPGEYEVIAATAAPGSRARELGAPAEQRTSLVV